MSWSKRQKALERFTLAELLAKTAEVRADPANANPAGKRSLYLYTPKAHRKLDDLAWAVRSKMITEGRAEA